MQRLEAEKAQQIFESLGVVDVLYNGSPVWIEDLDGEEAKVRYLESGQTIEVPVTELIEGWGGTGMWQWDVSLATSQQKSNHKDGSGDWIFMLGWTACICYLVLSGCQLSGKAYQEVLSKCLSPKVNLNLIEKQMPMC